MAKRAKMAWSNREAREALARYEGTVRMMARRLRPVAQIGQALDEDDLCAEGRVAVLEALTTYQGFGIEEQTWVRTRIRQRMIDAIRRLDLRSRDEMRLAVKHAAGETEGLEEIRKARVVVARRLVSIDSAPAESEPLAARIKDSIAPSVEQLAYANSQKHKLERAIKVLPPRQRQAIQLALFEGLSLREIGGLMGISESRVCQLQKRAVQHLNAAVADAPTSCAA